MSVGYQADELAREGTVKRQAGDLAAAEALLREALRLVPKHCEALHQLGVLSLEAGNLAPALVLLERSVQLRPGNPHYLNNLANAYRETRNYEKAIEVYRRAIRLEPNIEVFHSNLAVVLWQTERHDAGLVQAKKALRLKEGSVEALMITGNICKDLGRLDEALAAYAEALRLSDGMTLAYAHHNYLYSLNFHPDHTPSAIFAAHRAWAESQANPLAAAAPPRRSGDARRRLRIGYVSPHFRSHAVNFFTEPIILNHDRSEFAITCYSDSGTHDDVTVRLRAAVDRWCHILGLSDEEVARQVRADGIDILVDLSGHMGANRLLAFARKPAPVQVTYIGYQATTGLAAMDYRITDDYADPPGRTDAWHTEKLMRIPQAFYCYQPPEEAPEVADPPCLQRESVTFGSFNIFAKVTPQVLTAWAEILGRVPGSRLQLLVPNADSLRKRVLGLMADHKIDAKRIVFVLRSARRQYLERFQTVDLALDPFPFNSHTTSCDALWMGVPTVMLAGQSYVQRYGGVALKNLGLEDLIATTTEGYIDTAVRWASDPERLTEVRRSLRERMRTSVICDARGFTRKLEDAYRRMWHDHCIAPETEEAKPSGDDATGGVQATFLRGQDLLARCDLIGAEESYRRVLTIDQSHAEAWHGLGLVSSRLGRPAEATEQIERAVALHPESAVFRMNLANSYRLLGRSDEAEACYRSALSLRPAFVDASLALASLLHERGQTQVAVEVARQAVAQGPNSPRPQRLLAELLFQRGELVEADARLHFVASVDPNGPKSAFSAHPPVQMAPEVAARLHEVKMLVAGGRYEESETCCRALLDEGVDCAPAFALLGTTLELLRRLPEAVDCHRRAADLAPDFLLYQKFLARALIIDKAFEELVDRFGPVVRQYPQDVGVQMFRGVALRGLGRSSEAIDSFNQAVVIAPNNALCHGNLGITLKESGQDQAALRALERALELDPVNVDARVTRAQLLLLRGRYPEGWEEYRWRWRTPEQLPPSSLPLWDGSPLDDRTLLLIGEQGLGDNVQFARFIPLVEARAATIILALAPPLVRLARACGWAAEVVGLERLPVPADVYLPLGELPRVFSTTPESIPAKFPYVRVSAEAAAPWRGRFASDRLNVGIFWQGNPDNPVDRFRSMKLSDFQPLSEVPGVQLVNLQKGPARLQLANWQGSHPILDVTDDIEDFLDLGAAMEQLDLLIGCETGPAHLAGALARPTWLAISAAPDWRWLAEGEHSPWYPSTRLFRQTQLGRWSDVVDRIATALRDYSRPDGTARS